MLKALLGATAVLICCLGNPAMIDHEKGGQVAPMIQLDSD